MRAFLGQFGFAYVPTSTIVFDAALRSHRNRRRGPIQTNRLESSFRSHRAAASIS